jgi:hypothetical protein
MSSHCDDFSTLPLAPPRPDSPASSVLDDPDHQTWPIASPTYTLEGVVIPDEHPFPAGLSQPSLDGSLPRQHRAASATAGAPLTQPDRMTSTAREAGDFLCAHLTQAADTGPWPVMPISRFREQGCIPAVPPPVTPAIAAGRSDTTQAQPRQSQAASLLSEPFSDYNAVRPADRQNLPTPAPPEAADLPLDGQPQTVFVDSFILYSEGGDWVRDFIRSNPRHPSVCRRGSKGRGVRWTAAEIWLQTELWFQSAKADMDAFDIHGVANRARTQTLIIPDRCHRGGGRHIWDLRTVRHAQLAGQSLAGVRIPALDVGADIDPKLHSDRLRARLLAAGITDLYVVQQLLESGLISRTEAPRHTVLQMNYPGVSAHMRFARDLARRETAEAKLSQPFAAGIPIFPVRLNPYGAVERPDKDPRLCCDMSSPQPERDGGGSLSVNAGIPFHNLDLIAELKLTSAQAFARDVGILKSSPALEDSVWIATADWTAYYRNLLKPVAEWWTQLLWLDSAGPQIDLATCFGDAAAPAQSNRVQDAILFLIAHEFDSHLNRLRDDPKFAELLATMDEWTTARTDALSARFPNRYQAAADGDALAVIWVKRQRQLASLHGFFDDSLLASFVASSDDLLSDGKYLHTRTDGPFAALVASLLRVAEDIGLPVAAHKIACGSPDGRQGLLDLDHWKKTGEVCWFLQPGAMPALGKEIDLQSNTIRDTAKRVRRLYDDIIELCELARQPSSQRNGKCTVPVPRLRELIGKTMFVLQTEPHLRPGGNLPIRALRILESVCPDKQRAYLSRKPGERRSGRKPTKCLWFSWAYFPEAAQSALLDLAQGALPRSGVPFNPAVPSLGSDGRPTCWVLEDASGQDGGGGGAVYLDPRDPSTLAWSYDQFTPAELKNHSTFLEGLNANNNLRRAAEAGFLDVIEVLDNSSWVSVARSGRAHDDSLQPLLAERRRIRADFPLLCVYSVWQPREKGVIADAVSKLTLLYDGAGLPNLPTNQPITGNDWADAALINAGFPGGLDPTARIL